MHAHTVLENKQHKPHPAHMWNVRFSVAEFRGITEQEGGSSSMLSQRQNKQNTTHEMQRGCWEGGGGMDLVRCLQSDALGRREFVGGGGLTVDATHIVNQTRVILLQGRKRGADRGRVRKKACWSSTSHEHQTCSRVLQSITKP